MNIAKLVRQGGPSRTDGLPSTRELLEDPSSSYLRELTSPKHAEADLVAVHGLNFANANAFGVRTWTAGEKGAERLWLKDFLPHRLPNVRVLLFAYNSNVAFNTSKIGVGNVAEDLLHKLWTKRQSAPDRPLVFVCHSLGGLVVKRAMVKARNLSRYSAISQSAKSFAFFSTPHRGGHGAEVGQAAAGLVRRLGMNPRTGILEALRKDSHIAPDVNNDFVDGQDNYRICSFYECKPMPPLTALVVEKSSAILGLGPAETRIPCINADHSTICKFAFEDEDYMFVINEIEDLVSWAMKQVEGLPVGTDSFSKPVSISSTTYEPRLESSNSSISQHVLALTNANGIDFSTTDNNDYSQLPSVSDRQARKGPFFLVPYFQNPNFVGQESVLHYLKQVFNPAIHSHVQVGLYGMGGVGKTQIALAHAYWYQINFPERSVFWIQANDADQLVNSMDLVAAHCKISRPEDTTGGMLARMRDWLSDPSNGHWLVIIDSADNAETFSKYSENSKVAVGSQIGVHKPSFIGVEHYIPVSSHGKILLTTNNKSAAEQLIKGEHIVQVHPMDKANASALLRQRLPEKDISDLSIHHRAKVWLNDDLEKLALHLDHLPLALAQAASYMRENSQSVEEYLELIEHDESKLTGLLAHDSQRDGRTDDLSKAIQSTWNVGFNQIGTQCKSAADLLSLMAFFSGQRIPEFLLRHFQTDEWQLKQQSLKTLLAYSFITASENGTYGVHRLVQLAMRKRMSAERTERRWAVEALRLLSDAFPDGEYESWEVCAALVPHALKALNYKHYDRDEDIILGTLQGRISHYYVRQGLFYQAEGWSRKALDNMALAPAVKQENIWAVKSNRVLVMKELGRFEDAEDLAQEVWRERSAALGPKHKDTLKSMVTLSLIYQEQGRYLEGAKAMRKILKILERTLDVNHVELFAAKIRLSSSLQFLGQYAEAENYVRQAVEGYMKILGPRHPHTLKAQWCLARIYHAQGRYAKSEAVNFETWTAQKKVLGPDHPETIKSRHSYSNDLQAQHRFSAAESHMREIHSKAVELVGASHNYTLFAASSLASCLMASSIETKPSNPEQLAEAEHLYHLTLLDREKDLRLDHPVTLSARTDLTIVRRLRGQVLLSDLETTERMTSSKLKIVLGKEHPFTLRSRDNLARILWMQETKEKQKEALQTARKVFEISKKQFGWSQERTKAAAELVLDMLPEGREKQDLADKIATKTDTASK